MSEVVRVSKSGHASTALQLSLGVGVKQGVFVSVEMERDSLLESLPGV